MNANAELQKQIVNYGSNDLRSKSVDSECLQDCESCIASFYKKLLYLKERAYQ